MEHESRLKEETHNSYDKRAHKCLPTKVALTKSTFSISYEQNVVVRLESRKARTYKGNPFLNQKGNVTITRNLDIAKKLSSPILLLVD